MATRKTLEYCLKFYSNASITDSEECLALIVELKHNNIHNGFRIFFGETEREIRKEIEEYAKAHDREIGRILTIEEAEKLREKMKRGEYSDE